MTFQQNQIGPVYDIGLATRDGSTLACIDENGATKQLNQVAYMFSVQPGQQQTESTDLVRKDQLTRLSSSNVVDREFTLYPQVTQGTWVGGELQRVFNDSTSYYQGRGLIWPIGGTVPSRGFFVGAAIGGTTNWPGYISGGVYNGKVGYAFIYNTAGGNFISFQAGDGTAVTSGNLAGSPGTLIIANNEIFWKGAGNDLNTMSGAGPAIAVFAAGIYGPGTGGHFVTSLIGRTVYLATDTGSNNTILIYDASNAASFITVNLPSGNTWQSMAFLGSQLIIVVSDGFNSSIIGYDIPSATFTTISQLQGYSAIRIGTVSGGIFLACAYLQGVDCFLLVGSSLQFITTLPAQIAGTSTLTYAQLPNLSNVVGFGPYALFYAGTSLVGSIFAYDIQRGALFTASDSVGGIPGQGSLAVTTGMTSGSPTTVSSQWTIVMQIPSGVGFVTSLLSFGIPLSGSLWIPFGRIISSAIDFTSASLKLFRQIVVTHVPIPNSGQFYLAAWMDQDVDNLNATPDFSITNVTVTASSTTLLINKVARKLVYLVNYTTPNTTNNAPRPKSLAIQAATGWVWKIILAISNSARLNSQQSNTFCFAQQGFDGKAAYNFVRQLWRQKGGQCLATIGNGDQFNAVIESFDLLSPKPWAPTMSGDRKTHYEVIVNMTIREDA